MSRSVDDWEVLARAHRAGDCIATLDVGVLELASEVRFLREDKARLEARVMELGAAFRKFSAETPYPEEARNAGTLIAEVGTLRGQLASARHALQAALNVWCPRDPGGDGADGETYQLVKRAIGEVM